MVAFVVGGTIVCAVMSVLVVAVDAHLVLIYSIEMVSFVFALAVAVGASSPTLPGQLLPIPIRHSSGRGQ